MASHNPLYDFFMAIIVTRFHARGNNKSFFYMDHLKYGTLAIIRLIFFSEREEGDQ